ncbi:MAG: flagellar basal body-associated FliL family protein [Actinomycetota bacterium]|nr:flagellar basal body-associated FliL family protein [Actinomycetota bacterium]
MATTAKKAEEQSEEGAKKGGKKKLILIVLLVILAAAGGGVGASIFLGGSKPAKAAFVPPKVGPIYDFGQITTNLADGHLIQVSMSFQLGVNDLSADVSPLTKSLTSIAINDLSGWTYTQLLSVTAKQELAKELIKDFNKVIKVATGKNEITGIYYTSFIMQ